MPKFLLTLSFILFLFFSCNAPPSVVSTEKDESEIQSSDNFLYDLNENEISIMTIPAPLQIATVLRNNAPENYHSDWLMSSEKEIDNTVSSRIKAIYLGLYSVDLGYSTLYEQYKTAANYLLKSETILRGMGISDTDIPSYSQRFERNKNLDTLSIFILEFNNSISNYFQNNQREDLGLLVLTGSFIEGFYLLTSVATIENEINLQLIFQHQLFLNNIIKLLGYYDSKGESESFVNELKELNKLFEAINISKEDIANNNFKNKITAEQLSAIKAKVGTIRNELVNVK